MARIWSEESKLETWLRVELAALDAWAEVGVVPEADVRAIRGRAVTPSAERVAEIERVTDHDMAAFVDAVAEQLGPEGRWIHYGLTSSDVVDTALALQIQAAGVGQLSGTVGTYAQVEPEVERLACEALGLEPDPLSTQVVARDRHAELLSALALVATSLERFALEIRHLARTEVREVEEPFGAGMKGSSAMPHKRNPKVAERICGLARLVRATALVGFENVPLWHERDISHSSAERVVIPDAFLALDYMLDRFRWLVDGLVVHADRMRANLDASHGLVFSHRLLLALVDAGLGRDDAYRLVQRHALEGWEGGRDFRKLVAADPEIAGRLGPEGLASVFDLKASIRHVDLVFERLRALARKEEAVHV